MLPFFLALAPTSLIREQVTPLMERCDNPFNGLYDCGRCPHCINLRNWRWKQWVRLETLSHSKCWFVTLTYETVDLVYARSEYPQVQLFLKRLRSSLSRVSPGTKLRYFCVFEKGTLRERPHWHLLIWSTNSLTWDLLSGRHNSKRTAKWKHGYMHAKLVRSAHSAARYVTKYMTKQHYKKRGSQSLGFKTVSDVMSDPRVGSVFSHFPQARLKSINSIAIPGKQVNKTSPPNQHVLDWMERRSPNPQTPFQEAKGDNPPSLFSKDLSDVFTSFS